MNFIAHIHLSGSDSEILVGNYIADLIRHGDLTSLHAGIKKGILFHRYIDDFTDNHDKSRTAKTWLYKSHGKYAPVLLDLFYDYFLIRHWDHFSDKSFHETCEYTYLVLEKYYNKIPDSVQPHIDRLFNERWLEGAYSDLPGLNRTLYFLKKRVSRPDLIDRATITLTQNEVRLEQVFLDFYPDLVKEAYQYLGKLKGRI